MNLMAEATKTLSSKKQRLLELRLTEKLASLEMQTTSLAERDLIRLHCLLRSSGCGFWISWSPVAPFTTFPWGFVWQVRLTGLCCSGA